MLQKICGLHDQVGLASRNGQGNPIYVILGDHRDMQESSPTRVYIHPEWMEWVTPKMTLQIVRALQKSDSSEYDEFTRDHFVSKLDYSEIVELSDLDSAHFILLPIRDSFESNDHQFVKTFSKLVESAKSLSARSGKPVVVHSYSKDVVNPLIQWKDIPTAFKKMSSSLIRNRQSSSSIALPYFVPDYLKQHYSGVWRQSEILRKPAVGFCGIASPLGCPRSMTTYYDWLRLCATYIEFAGLDSNVFAEALGTNMKHAHRARVISILRNDKDITSRIILRDTGALVSKKYYREPINGSFNKDYYNNIRNSDYTICSRGTENYSIRFYETFCMGRIPILVDTNVVLPFESRIDYGKNCVLVPPKKIHEVADLLKRYHRSNGQDGIAKIQRENREIWEKYLSATGFYRELGSYIARGS